MGFPLLFAAIILFAAAYQNQLHYLATQLEQDFSGYLRWLIAILLIAAIGLIPKAKPIATALLVLVILVLIISNRSGFFTNVQNIRSSIVAPPQSTTPGEQAQPTTPGPGVKQTGTPVNPDQGPANSQGSAGGINVPSFLAPFATPILKFFPGLN